jgi:anti-sigma B factor antagonist
VSSSKPGKYLKTEDLGEVTRVSFPGQNVALDEASTEQIGEQLFRLVEELGRCRLHLEFGNVTYLTSSTLGMLLLLHKKLQTVGGGLVLTNMLPQIYEIFAITNLNRLLDIRQNEAQGAVPKGTS